MIDILQLLVPIIIALIIASLINKKVYFYQRKTELCLDLLSSFEKKIHKINKDAYEYFNQKTNEFENIIVASLKESSIELDMILKIKNRKKKPIIYDTKKLIKYFFAFKKALTDTPFEDRDNIITINEINEVEHKYKHLLNKILEAKLSLFE